MTPNIINDPVYCLLNADEFFFAVSVYFIANKTHKWQLPVVNVPAKLLILDTLLFSWVHWLPVTSEGLIRHPYFWWCMWGTSISRSIYTKWRTFVTHIYRGWCIFLVTHMYYVNDGFGTVDKISQLWCWFQPCTCLSIKQRNGGHFSLSRISTKNRIYVLEKSLHPDEHKERKTC